MIVVRLTLALGEERPEQPCHQKKEPLISERPE
jgi:hypothetical protein